MDEGILASWLVAEGSTVAQGDEVAEIETSKIANVLEAPAGGVLRRRVVHEGEVRPVGALLGVVADAEEDESLIDEFVASFEAVPLVQKVEAGGRTAQTTQVEGLATRFLKIAGTADRLGAPLILLHGFGGDHLNWMLNQESWAVGRDVYALDLPGHGGSAKDVGDGSLETLAARVEVWLEAQGLSSVHLVGHSMGAAVAATLALEHPGRVRSLAAVCGAGFGGALDRRYLEGFIEAPRRKELKPVVELLFADPGQVTRQMLDDLIAYKRIDGVAEALRKLVDGALSEAALTRLRGRIGQVSARKLLIFGSNDRIVTPPDPQGLTDEVLIIPAAGHMPQLEAAAATNAAVAAFLAAGD